eukprot:366296-Chlamydomonas_euryale.AAC.4
MALCFRRPTSSASYPSMQSAVPSVCVCMVNGALCDDSHLAEEDLEVIASGIASVKSKEKRECV